MKGTFKVEPSVLSMKGNEICDQATIFANKIDEIFNSVDTLLNSGYVSEGAKVIGESIKNKRDDLNKIKQIMENYGVFCKESSNAAVRNDENIAQTYKI